MPAYFFDKLVNLVGDDFDMEFKSMKDLYEKEQGDPVERLRAVSYTHLTLPTIYSV